MPMIQGINCFRSTRNSREPQCHDCLLVCVQGLLQCVPHVTRNLCQRAKREINSLRTRSRQSRQSSYVQMNRVGGSSLLIDVTNRTS
jgi:hypothetical protein